MRPATERNHDLIPIAYLTQHCLHEFKPFSLLFFSQPTFAIPSRCLFSFQGNFDLKGAVSWTD